MKQIPLIIQKMIGSNSLPPNTVREIRANSILPARIISNLYKADEYHELFTKRLVVIRGYLALFVEFVLTQFYKHELFRTYIVPTNSTNYSENDLANSWPPGKVREIRANSILQARIISNLYSANEFSEHDFF